MTIMSEAIYDKLCIPAVDMETTLTIRDQLRELGLFKSFRFDVGRLMYFVYINTVDDNTLRDLVALVSKHNYRLLTYNN